jgi:GT2 family glycosyltransferase
MVERAELFGKPENLEGCKHLPDTLPLSVGVLVLNFNTWDLALRALDAAIRLEPELVQEFVLFDDGSATSPPPEIDRRIRLIRGEANRGFARALNTAVASMKSDVIVLFDSDAYPLTSFAARVRARFESDHQLGQLGFLAEDQNGSPTESFFSQPSKWSLLLGQKLYAHVPRKAPKPSNLCLTTGCMATRLEAYKQVGGFDEGLDFLDVDVDYSMRLRGKGWNVAVDTLLKAFHLGGGTPQLQRHRLLRFYKSRWYLLRKHGLITKVGLARTFILARLLLERTVLQLFGSLMFTSPAVREDKILGRSELITYGRQHYY